MNRSETIFADKDGLYIFAECPHCHEPQAIIPSKSKEPDIHKCYCRGANGLSFNIKCCYVLNCIKKKGHLCDHIWPVKESYPAKQWNVIVVEKVVVPDA